MEKKKLKKKWLIIIPVALLLIIGGTIGGIFIYQNINGVSSKLVVKLVGKSPVTVEVGKEYKESGSTAKYEKEDLTKDVKVSGKVDTTKLGNYLVKYTVKYKKVKKSITRKVKVVDKTAPELTLSGEDVSIIVGNDYKEPGYEAKDNYDGVITDKVKATNNINKDQVGDYEVKYEVEDSSKNKTTKTRKVKVIEKPKNPGGQGIAVLNYHFFYDTTQGQTCGDSICYEISKFKEHLKWFNDNGYKTLTMTEFRDWMYGYTELPEKSVLITIDDGAAGTGKHNGNLLIPALEEYKAHATLFLITGWWDISNYQGSQYLEIQSHSNDMHNEGWCSGVTRGARMLCQDNETVKNDLLKSIEIVKDKTSYCFPFYAYDDRTVNIVKEVGFEMAFVGGSRKAKRTDNKWMIPRYPIIQGSHGLNEIIEMVS